MLHKLEHYERIDTAAVHPMFIMVLACTAAVSPVEMYTLSVPQLCTIFFSARYLHICDVRIKLSVNGLHHGRFKGDSVSGSRYKAPVACIHLNLPTTKDHH